tara:strand:- start:178846 stop:179229 length:384 start_codon:yes stop_codon:yes gene_type:complete
MKLYFAIIFIAINSAIGFGQSAEFKFLSSTTHKWDKTPEGELLEHYFVYENSGDAPLTINDAKVSCSCTKIDYPNAPTLPGEQDSIRVTFNTEGKFYMQDRKIEIYSNASRKEKLRIKVFVIPKEED